MPLAHHLVARTRGGWRRVVEPASAQWVWTHLRLWSPTIDAALGMPDHLHALPPGDADVDGFRRVLQHHGRIFGVRWELAPPPQPVHSSRILARTVRYILLNALRDRLVDDPFEWPCSTLRDLAGAVADPWVALPVLAARVRMSPAALLRYATDGARPPSPTPNRGLVAPLDAVVAAVASSHRVNPNAMQRRGPARASLVDLAYATGTPNPVDLAELMGISTRAVRALRGRASPAALAAAHVCLGDPRLRRWRP